MNGGHNNQPVQTIVNNRPANNSRGNRGNWMNNNHNRRPVTTDNGRGHRGGRHHYTNNNRPNYTHANNNSRRHHNNGNRPNYTSNNYNYNNNRPYRNHGAGRINHVVRHRPNRGYAHRPVVVNNYNYANQPYIYSDYGYRRRCRRSLGPLFFFSLGYYAVRPYSSYYYRTGYDVPLIYGDESYYRSPPPQVADTTPEVASTVPQVAPTPLPNVEEAVLGSLTSYVTSRSTDDAFQIADPALENKVWKLDLSQAPALYSIDDNHYTVVAGFEGTLGDHPLPSSVGIEFFVAREGSEWIVKDAWIVSANGIVREKRFQSPTFPQVKTWQEGVKCPFSGKPMVPVTNTETGSLGGASNQVPTLGGPTL